MHKIVLSFNFDFNMKIWFGDSSNKEFPALRYVFLTNTKKVNLANPPKSLSCPVLHGKFILKP